ncbi:MAG TPA: hypothetical protein VHQ04_06325, partial [Puia sp.]|nr:hypothetical protein [Puia sp.]
MKYYLSLLLFFFFSLSVFSQSVAGRDSVINKIADSLISKSSAGYAKNIRDSIVKKVRDSLFWADLEKKAVYPLIKNSEMS